MNENERDTHFQGFAKLLWDELVNLNEYGYIDVSDGFDDGIDPIDYRKLIAQRVYDLVAHVVKESKYIQFHGTIITDDDYKNATRQMIAEIPDLTEWPEPPNTSH